MKIVVIGGTGLIGSKTVAILRQRGHEAVIASPNTGVNTITGEGLKQAMAGTQVVIDLANSPSFEDKVVLEFFETSGRNLLAAEAAAKVRHHVALSIVAIGRTMGISAPSWRRRNGSKTPTSPTQLSARPSLWNSSAASPIQARRGTESGFRPSCSSRSRQTMWLLTLPTWRSRHRATASSRSQARNARRSTKSSRV